MKRLIFIIFIFLGLNSQAQNMMFYGHNGGSFKTLIIENDAALSFTIINLTPFDLSTSTIVRWGDGSSSVYSGELNNITHNYSASQQRTIIINSSMIKALNLAVNEITTINIDDHTDIESLALGGNNITNVNFLGNNTELTDVSFTNNNINNLNLFFNTKINGLYISNNNNGPTLSTLEFLPLIINLQCDNNPFSEEGINYILITLDGFGLSDGYATMINSSAPSGAGITAKNSLISKGWTVSTD